MPDRLKWIEEGTFESCVKLKTVRFPAALESIGSGAFMNTALEALVLPEGVIRIESVAFANCRQLKEVVLPDGLKQIEAETFIHCLHLKSIRFPAKLTVIKEKAFRGNGFLEPVELPPSVRLIEGDAFTACSRLRHVIVPEDCFIIAPNFRRAEIRFYSKPEEKF